MESGVFEDRRPILEQIADYESTIQDFITRLDNHVWKLQPGIDPDDKITPDDAKQRFEQFNKGEVKYLPVNGTSM